MALESLTGAAVISSLDETNPLDSDYIDDGDGHIRGIKNVLKNTFPNLDSTVTASPGDLNKVDVTYYSVGSGLQSWVVSHVYDGEYNGGPLGGPITSSTSLTGGAVTENSFESFGKTGAGADNTWVAMDNLPSGITGLWLQFRLRVQDASSGLVNANIWTRTPASVLPANDNTLLYSWNQYVAAGVESTFYSPMVWTPVDSSGLFDITWNCDADTTEVILMYLKGFTQ